MNYLAHAFLSFHDEPILVGNLMGDFIKGKRLDDLPKDVQRGVKLHRFIDSYTDSHPLVLEATAYFKQHYRLSGGVFVDIFFDYFLANHQAFFDEASLYAFTNGTYNVLHKYNYLFDDKMLRFFGYMKEFNWLYNYKFKEGIEKSIRGICKRHPVLGEPDMALDLFESKNHELLELFNAFFPDLASESKQFYDSFS